MNKKGGSLFWADQLADRIEGRARRERRRPNIKCQQTPSGGKHIGNLNDVARAYFPYKSLRERGVRAEFVHTTDDRDPLKAVPRRLADLDGRWHESKGLKDMSSYFGMPLCRIPDPFGCCGSWSEHFTRVWMDGVHALGMHPDLHSVDRLYKEGRFDPFIKRVFERADVAGEIASEHQRTKSKDYIPYDAICPNCGLLTNISSFDIKRRKVAFTCGGKAIREKRSEGCGYSGEASWREGKLQWRFEWSALFALFRTTYEPFGKDHAEGSWKSAKEICRRILDVEPPIPFVYEFFLVNGEKMSASVGNTYIVQDMLRIMEPEAFLFYYTKKPAKQRDLDLENIILLIDGFERAERVYFGKERASERDRRNLSRQYQMSVERVPRRMPLRIPYQFASVISQVVSGEGSSDRAIGILQKTGHLGKRISKKDREAVERRLEFSGNWVRSHAAQHYRISLAKRPDPRVLKKLTKGQREALSELGERLSRPLEEKELYDLFWELSRRHGTPAQELFRAAYLVLIGKEQGPRLAPFILAAGQGRVAKVLKGIR